MALLELGPVEEALASQQEALRLCERLGEPTFEAVVRFDLGELFRAAGRPDRAEAEYGPAARRAAAGGDIRREAESLVCVAELTRHPTAVGAATTALDRLGRPHDEALAARLAAVGPPT